MKIGIVLSKVPGYSETFMVSKVKGLVASGYDVILFVNEGKRARWHQASVIPAAKVNRFLIVKWFRVLFMSVFLCVFYFRTTSAYWKLLREAGVSVSGGLRNLYINSHILTHRLDWLHFGFATMALEREMVARALGAKLSVSFRGYDINVYPLKHPGCYKKLWSEVNKVHSISKDLFHSAVVQGLCPSIDFAIINPAINLELFTPAIMGGKNGTPLQLLTVARLTWIKGLEYAIAATHLLKEQGVKINYNIVGDGDLYERLMFAIHQYNVEDCVHLLGPKKPEEIIALMHNCDIYLQTSLQEGFCNAVVEAQASGCLCIVSDTGGLRENVADEETGWLVPKRNPEALATKILHVMALKPEQKQWVRAAAIKRVKQNFDLAVQVERFVKFFS